MSGLGKRRRAMGILGFRARWVGSAASSEWGKPFGYELQQRRTVSNANNLTMRSTHVTCKTAYLPWDTSRIF